MDHCAQLAKHFSDVHFGGNWTTSSLKEHLKDVSWEQAIAKVHTCNTIASLVFHINYYVGPLIRVLQGGALDASDSLSFALKPITGPQDWENLLAKTFSEAETLAQLVAKMPEDILGNDFTDPKYGTYYRNILGVIEHTYYHLGQIVIVKKLLSAQKVPARGPVDLK